MDSTISRFIEQHFICSITKEIAYDPVVCPCGHLFDAPAIYEWLDENFTCPISRNWLRPSMITQCFVTRRVLDTYGITRLNYVPMQVNNVSTQVDEDAFTASVVNLPLPPVIIVADIELSVSDLNDDCKDYLRDGMMRDIYDGCLFNETSLNRNIGHIVERHNNHYLLAHGIKLNTHTHIAVRKYTYHFNGTVMQAAKALALKGYFVYDIFRVCGAGFNTRFCVYSCDRLSDGTINPLHLFSQRKR